MSRDLEPKDPKKVLKSRWKRVQKRKERNHRWLVRRMKEWRWYGNSWTIKSRRSMKWRRCWWRWWRPKKISPKMTKLIDKNFIKCMLSQSRLCLERLTPTQKTQFSAKLSLSQEKRFIADLKYSISRLYRTRNRSQILHKIVLIDSENLLPLLLRNKKIATNSWAHRKRVTRNIRRWKLKIMHLPNFRWKRRSLRLKRRCSQSRRN